jgi:signal transduction histidine kinase
LLKNEEQKKQKIAIDLHEGLVQTLSAIKVNVESSSERIKAYDANTKPLENIVPVLQSAIQEVRSIATELRPSSLDDLGLLPTVNWFCREFEQQHKEIVVDRKISLQEGMIPAPLKIVIYRIIESTFKNIAQGSYTDQIMLAMQWADNKIHLRISDTPVQQTLVDAFAQFKPDTDPQFRFAEMKERASLSGGTFTATQDSTGWNTLHVSWAC